MDSFIRKVIAKDGERIYFESTNEEMNNFIANRIRNDFKDESIICIRFDVSTDENFSDYQSTEWYINPFYYRKATKFFEDECGNLIEVLDDDSPELDKSIHEVVVSSDAYGPRMDSRIIPEFLLTNAYWEIDDFLELYFVYYDSIQDKDYSDSQIFNDFFEQYRKAHDFADAVTD